MSLLVFTTVVVLVVQATPRSPRRMRIIRAEDEPMKYFYDFIDEIWPRVNVRLNEATLLYQTKLPRVNWCDRYAIIQILRGLPGVTCEDVLQNATFTTMQYHRVHVEPTRAEIYTDAMFVKFFMEATNNAETNFNGDATYYVFDKEYDTCYTIESDVRICPQKHFDWKTTLCDAKKKNSKYECVGSWEKWLEENYRPRVLLPTRFAVAKWQNCE